MKISYGDVTKMFEETQVPKLLEVGFKRENITVETVKVSPAQDCRYYSHNEIIAPRIIR